uniref:Myosin motor domain-containing protein n=1 Tax=Amphora coffeiformis TaxID=265554 RepID=A0A7S3P970_9STRA
MAPKKDSGGAEATSSGVYVLDKEFAWIPARLIDQTGDTAKVSIPTYADEASILTDGGKGAKSWREETVSLKHYPGKALPLQNMLNGSLNEKEDMVDLPFLHEAAILYNIKARHVKALPYTRTGDIIIAVNPYQWLTHLYTEEQKKLYSDKLVWEASEVDPRKNVEPHVYETSSLCYKGLAVDGVNQSVLVSGESGAGKTETVKICMNHIASVQAGPSKRGEKEENLVVKRVVESNPLLEGFGNAKTRRNDNSSRFGKYLQLQFDRDESGAPPGTSVPPTRLAGSKCEVYLLEKSRVVGHDAKEGTYHIFYQLCAAKDEDKAKIWSELKGKSTKDFKYVGDNSGRKIDGMSDGEHYYETCKALALIGCEGERLLTLMRAIAVVMQLGNLNFGGKFGDQDRSAVSNKSELDLLSDLIGIPEKDLENAFTERAMVTRGETFKVQLKPDAAKENCDAFAKEVYAKIFLWLVREINSATCAEDNYKGARSSDFGTIGLLDIFGFESFPVNGFEQLCINYANEKLQQKFTKDIFQAVMEEYKFEGIALKDIKYDDNSDVLDLIEGRAGLLAMLNEECVRPKGSDREFVFKAKNSNKGSACLINDKLMGPMDFGIHHYAGKVVYYADGFISRNQDSLSSDLQDAAKKSSNDIIANHLQNEAQMNSDAAAPKVAVSSGPKRGKSNIASDTVWTKFRTQLNSLMKMLNETQSRYVRCVKPNTVKKPLVMQHMTTVEQLRCAGVVAAVTISRSAFPNRLDHRACWERFKVVSMTQGGGKKNEKIDVKEEITKLLTKILAPLKDKGEEGGPAAFVVGKTRVYFRMGTLEFLEAERMKCWDKWALEMQRSTRGWLVRKKTQNLRLSRKAPKAVAIQCMVRILLAKKDFKRRRKLAKHQKKLGKKRNKAAAKIQATVRMCQWRPKFKAMLKEKREREGLKKKLKDLETAVKEAEKQRIKEVEEARAAAEAEMEEYRLKVKQELENDKEKQKRSAQQQSLIEESGKIIEYLRKENMKLRNQNETLRKDFKSLKENNARLMEANASAGASFSALNDHAKQLNLTNAKLIRNVEAYKGQLEKLKDDLKTRQAYYLAEAEARLAYQKTMAQIVGAIQDKCRDAQLVEDVVIMALECEAEAKSERAALEAATHKNKSQSASKASSSASKPSLAASQDSDSDSD